MSRPGEADPLPSWIDINLPDRQTAAWEVVVDSCSRAGEKVDPGENIRCNPVAVSV